MVKNLPAMQETRVWSLRQEDPLEKGMATHSSILAWRVPRTEEPGGLQSMRLQRADLALFLKINKDFQNSGSRHQIKCKALLRVGIHEVE